MTVAFVHGVPDTHRVWDAVLSRLARTDAVALSLPGFGCPLPEGFEPTKEGYAEWLIGELSALAPPVDLVGHDWGAILAVRAVSLEPRLVRTWAAGAAPLDAEYEWHRVARLWQTPGVGEQVMATLTPDAMAAALRSDGVPQADAAAAASRVDDAMKRAILSLYRSAVHVGRQWEGDLAKVSAPGPVLWGERNPFAAPRFGEKLAARTGARFVAFPGCSHWWQLERPAETAAELERHWASAARQA